ncbi:nitroreductase family protein [Nonomuraea sp. NPDC050310]|uniref:Acg family FMN-binding oxidoreductase n=1 Tax=Nonomuraea sp. NPDC050310 TaxID=3154935 RepID=UPI0033C4859C
MKSKAVTKADALHAAVEAARWAPSVHNTQPWTFAVAGEEISLRADTERKLRIGDADGRELLVSCGAALFTLRTALACQGYEPAVRVAPDPDRPSLLALVRPVDAIEADEHTRLLGEQIKLRRTHRAGFTTLPVPDRLVDMLTRQAAAEGARLVPFREPPELAIVAGVTRAAQGAQSRDRLSALEVSRWARPPGSSRTDGVPARAYPREATRGGFAQRDYARGHDWGYTADQRLSDSAGVVALLTTTGDAREDWLAAGQALQRILLHAAAYGLSAAFHTQALEFPLLRAFLSAELCDQAHPQMIMRLGFTFDDTTGVRRPLSEVLEIRDESP